MNRYIRRIVTFASLTAGSFAVLPAGLAFAQQPQDPPAQASPQAHHRAHRSGMVEAALRIDSLTPEQRNQIDQLARDRRAAAVPVRQADARVLTLLAQQVESSQVDPQALGPSLATERAAATQEEAVDRATLARLHTILSPAQRSALVDRLESRVAPGGAKAGHWGGAGAEKLGLTQEQKAQIRANLHAGAPGGASSAERQAKRGERRTVLESFRGDSFDAAAMVRLEGRGEREVRMARAMVPVLTAEQRATFAGLLRQRAAHESRS
jgi:Spy/CpxP family protein refolding chaperone